MEKKEKQTSTQRTKPQKTGEFCYECNQDLYGANYYYPELGENKKFCSKSCAKKHYKK
jgi:hypothetical protein